MGLPKGKTNNKAGRPKGSKSKVTLSLRAQINDFLAGNFDKFKRDLELLEPRDRINAYIKLLSFGIPTLQSVDSKAEITTKLEKLNVDQLEKMIDEILEDNG